MQNVKELCQRIYQEASPVMENLDQGQMEAAVLTICSAKKIFVAGMGRTGYMMRAFAMRLMQMGLDAHMIGDTDTPCAYEGDLLIIGSGSGETESLKGYAAKAHKLGVKVLVLTGHPDSTLGRTADLTVVIPVNEETCKDPSGAIKVRETGNHGERMLLGSKSELCTMLTGEILVMMIFQQLGISEADMMRRHACFE